MEDTQQNPLQALQSLIERHIGMSDEIRHRVKTISESMKSMMENDTELSEVQQQADEIVKKVSSRKKTIAESPEFRSYKAKLAEMKDELKELEESLNTHLLTYYQQTGVKTVDLSSGKQREFRITARVLPVRKQKED